MFVAYRVVEPFCILPKLLIFCPRCALELWSVTDLLALGLELYFLN